MMTEGIKGHVFCLRSDVFPLSLSLDCIVHVDAPQGVNVTFLKILTAIYVKIAVFGDASSEVASSLRQSACCKYFLPAGLQIILVHI